MLSKIRPCPLYQSVHFDILMDSNAIVKPVLENDPNIINKIEYENNIKNHRPNPIPFHCGDCDTLMHEIAVKKINGEIVKYYCPYCGATFFE